MNSFAEELQIRERCTLWPVSEQTPRLEVKEKRDFGFGFRHGQIRVSPTSSTLFSNQEGPLPNMWCTFCNGPHPSNKCAVVTDPETRKNIVRQKGRCFGCLQTSNIIFFMWKCNVEQRLTMRMRTQNSRLKRMGKNCPFENQVALPTGPFLFLRQEFVPFNGRPRLVTHLF